MKGESIEYLLHDSRTIKYTLHTLVVCNSLFHIRKQSQRINAGVHVDPTNKRYN